MGLHRYAARGALLVLAGAFFPNAGQAEDFSAVCEQAAQMASQQSGVPVSVLKAISLNETGRKHEGEFRPWAWTVNMEGAGHWFDTRDEARAYVFKEFKRGARSFDIGCFQINYKWHHTAFSSIDEMFEPTANALYAAKFLTELYNEFGDWTKAAGAFHSRTPKHATSYAARFNKFRDKFREQDGQLLRVAMSAGSSLGDHSNDVPEIPDIVQVANAQRAPDLPRVNRYPLLRTGTGTALGSLVPIDRTSQSEDPTLRTVIE
jgi:hypothetical protein